MKLKTIFNCEQCGYQSQKWIGRCPECEAWNSFQEEVVAKNEDQGIKKKPLIPTSLEHHGEIKKRLLSNIEELDRVLGGGIVEGNVILLSGEPGIGKSTLTLQLCGKIADSTSSVLYISGEESHHQIAMRAKRLHIENKNIKLLPETDFESIMATIENEKPGCVILDSIQVVYSSEIPSLAGSINQVRFCTEKLVHFAKKTGTPVIIIGHVTKEGNLAGPRVLEHLVDTVLFLEGERYQNFRLIRSLKNRFGSTSEVGIFEMTEDGLKEIKNASQLFVQGRKKDSIGSAITATIEGTRPLLIEVQALTNISPFGYPKRATSGFDLNRMQLLTAVVQKHLRLNLSNQDIYVNIVGGLKLSEPAVDLAVVMAIISSFKKQPLQSETVYIGEIGLSGELRPVIQVQKRIQESEKLGFQKIVMPKTSEKIKSTKIKIEQVEDLEMMMKTLF